MEDSKKRKENDEGRMIELTPAMEIDSRIGTKIIDLTEVLQAQPKTAPKRPPEPDRPSAVPAPEKPVAADIESDVAAAFDVIEAEQSAAPPAAAAPAEPVKESPVAEEDAEVYDLEVPAAAFEETPATEENAMEETEVVSAEAPVADSAEPAPETAVAKEESFAPDDTLDLTEQVIPIDLMEEEKTPDEEALAIDIDFGDNASSEAPADEGIAIDEGAIEPADIDQPAEPQDSPEISVAEDTEEIELTERIELEDIADTETPAAADAPEISEDEEDLIELTDLVERAEYSDTREMPVAETEEDTEEDLIDLTDLVEPAELNASPEMPLADVDEIELTDRVEAEALPAMAAPIAEEDDDEIIELTDIVDPAELAALMQTRRDEQEEDDTIELSDIVDRTELAAMQTEQPTGAMDDDDDAIELNEVVDPAEVAAALEQSRTDLPDDDEEDEVIDLMERVEPTETQPSHPADIERTHPPDHFSDQVIHLDRVLDHVRKNKEKLVEDITLGVEEALVKETLGEDGEGEKMAIGMEMADAAEDADRTPGLSGKELEQAVENVIRAKYGQTIEQLIAKTVEKVVTREIEHIKRNLMEDQDLIDD